VQKKIVIYELPFSRKEYMERMYRAFQGKNISLLGFCITKWNEEFGRNVEAAEQYYKEGKYYEGEVFLKAADRSEEKPFALIINPEFYRLRAAACVMQRKLIEREAEELAKKRLPLETPLDPFIKHLRELESILNREVQEADDRWASSMEYQWSNVRYIDSVV